MNINEFFLEGFSLPGPLFKQEVYDLLNKVKLGDSQAKSKLVEHNIRLVVYEVINRFKYVKCDRQDLVSIGNIGLLNAISSYDA